MFRMDEMAWAAREALDVATASATSARARS
jgi:hypothetical protein